MLQSHRKHITCSDDPDGGQSKQVVDSAAATGQLRIPGTAGHSYVYFNFDDDDKVTMHTSDDKRLRDWAEAVAIAQIRELTTRGSYAPLATSCHVADAFPLDTTKNITAVSRSSRLSQPVIDFKNTLAELSPSSWQHKAPLLDSPLDNDSDVEQPKSLPLKTQQANSFRISDAPKVKDFLETRLRRMQQNVVKRLAKAWIKGICPKKQAKFPYQKTRHGVPKWWPPTEVCRFTEPDHIKKLERLELCLYLLRLRPSPEELKEWNDDAVEPHTTHVTKGWTAFLKDVAPPGMLSELREPDGVTLKRQQYLHDLYEVAHLEEQYEVGGIDASTIFSWIDDKDKTSNTKRNEADEDMEDEVDQKPVGLKRPIQDLVDTDSDSDVEPLVPKASKAKKPRPAKGDSKEIFDNGKDADVPMTNLKKPRASRPSKAGRTKRRSPPAVRTFGSNFTRPANPSSQQFDRETHATRRSSTQRYVSDPGGSHSLPMEGERNQDPFPNGLPTDRIWPYGGMANVSFSSVASSNNLPSASGPSLQDANRPMSPHFVECHHPHWDKPGPRREDRSHAMGPPTIQPYVHTVPNSPALPQADFFAMHLEQQWPTEVGFEHPPWEGSSTSFNHQDEVPRPIASNYSRPYGCEGLDPVCTQAVPIHTTNPMMLDPETTHTCDHNGDAYMTKHFPPSGPWATGDYQDRHQHDNRYFGFNTYG